MTNAICAVYNYMQKIEIQNFELTKEQYYTGNIKRELVRLLSRCSSRPDRKTVLQLEKIWYKNLRTHIVTNDADTRFMYWKKSPELSDGVFKDFAANCYGNIF